MSTVFVNSAKVSFEADGVLAKGPVGAVLEGSGFSFFIFGAGDFDEYYDFESGIASRMHGSKRAYVGVFGPYLGAGTTVTRTKFEVKNREITNLNFWACKNTDDPHGFSKDFVIIAVSEKSQKNAPFEECTPVKIKIKDQST